MTSVKSNFSTNIASVAFYVFSYVKTLARLLTKVFDIQYSVSSRKSKIEVLSEFSRCWTIINSTSTCTNRLPQSSSRKNEFTRHLTLYYITKYLQHSRLNKRKRTLKKSYNPKSIILLPRNYSTCIKYLKIK